MFSERKVAQEVVYLLSKTTDRTLDRVALMKLLYLADREAINQLGAPISGDRLVAMRLGPCLSYTLDLIEGERASSPNGWQSMLGNSKSDINKVVAHSYPVPESDFSFYDELSQAEIEILDETWNAFGHMTQWQLVRWAHTHLPEWKDPGTSSHVISVQDIGEALGLNPEEVKEVVAALAEQDALHKMFADA